jgi:orotate phosphoribosyltransferase
MRAAGALVTEVVAVVDREEGGKEALASIDVILRALVTSEELMQAAKSGTPSKSLP